MHDHFLLIVGMALRGYPVRVCESAGMPAEERPTMVIQCSSQTSDMGCVG